jgi:segregation and condensation protein B
MPSKVDDLVLRVEAVLFAAGKPLSVKELTETLNANDHRPVQRAVKKLTRTYEQRQTALEVRRVGDRYALQLRETFVPAAHAVTPVDMAPRTLKTLTLIAYHQPLVQSRLVRMIGETAYGEVQRLRDVGLVHAEPKGSTLELTTTRVFAEQFGIASTKPEEIRRFLEQKLGVTAALANPTPEGTTPAATPDASQGNAPTPETPSGEPSASMPISG